MPCFLQIFNAEQMSTPNAMTSSSVSCFSVKYWLKGLTYSIRIRISHPTRPLVFNDLMIVVTQDIAVAAQGIKDIDFIDQTLHHFMEIVF